MSYFLPIFSLVSFLFQLFCWIACVVGITFTLFSPCEMEIKYLLFWLRTFIPSLTCWNDIITVPPIISLMHVDVSWACMWCHSITMVISVTSFVCLLLTTDQDVSRSYSTMDGRHTPQSRRPTPDREVQEQTGTLIAELYFFKSLNKK